METTFAVTLFENTKFSSFRFVGEWLSEEIAVVLQVWDNLSSLSTAQGAPVDHISNVKSFLYQKERQFDSISSISNYKFKASNGPFGTLNLSIVYDTNLNKLEKTIAFDFKSFALELDRKPTTVREDNESMENSSGSVISAGSFCEIETDRSTQLPSPFPSPRFQKRIVAYQPNISETDSRLKQRRSSLHITISRSSSTSSLESEYDDEEEDALLNRNGIEIKKVNFCQLGSPNRSVLSPELFGSFVGSYEESILTGRMSTTPSKPIHFIADIGALAASKCKSSLKCPPHLIVSFPAFFYQLPGEDMPTPYVGTVDFGIHNSSKKKLGGEGDCKLENGCYRLPHKGQLQIVYLIDLDDQKSKMYCNQGIFDSI
jgi:hypothetical protein